MLGCKLKFYFLRKNQKVAVEERNDKTLAVTKNAYLQLLI